MTSVSATRPDWVIFRRLLDQARPYWPHLGGILLLSLLGSPLTLLGPLPWKIVIDSILGAKPLPGIFLALLPGGEAAPGVILVLGSVLVVVIGLLRQLQLLATLLLQTYAGQKLVLDFRARLFQHIQRLSLAYHDTIGTSDSTYRIQYDAQSIDDLLVTGLGSIVTLCFTVMGLLYVLIWIDWQLAAVALGVAPLVLLMTHAARSRLRARWPEVKQYESAAMSVVQEALAAVRVVKAFGQEAREYERFVNQSSRGLRGELHLALIQGGAGLAVGLTLAVGTAVVLFVGVRHVQDNILSLGELVVVMVYLAQLYFPLDQMSKKVTDLQAALVSAERAFSLLDESPDVPDRPGARPIQRARGGVAFRSVSFGYERQEPVLDAVSFEAAPGTRVGIAGATGAGKTTLISLLTRFYDPTAGQILLDGVDLRDYRLADLRNQFAVVLQEPVLFSASIAENIAYARSDATPAEIEAAAAAASAHEFITRLPRGYETAVGERGMRLSGGERQRISLARAFLKNAPTLILDEPTSSVDVETEAAITAAMERLMEGRTALIISHRPSVLEHCDVLLVIEGGRLVSERTAARSSRSGYRASPVADPASGRQP